MRKLYLILIVCLTTIVQSHGQINKYSIRDTTIFAPLASVSYAAHLPFGDLKDRFGFNNNIGAFADFKLSNNITLGLNGTFFFGNQVTEEGLLQNLINSDGNIVNMYGEPGQYLVQERGFSVTVNAGYVWCIIGPNPNSGIWIKGGVGFLQHKIRIDNKNNYIPQLSEEYLPGYDRLTNGVVVHGFLGYLHMSNTRLATFYLGVDSFTGFTYDRRAINFDTQTSNTDQRTDLFLGLRLGWIVPIYKRAPQDYYYQ